MGVLALFDESWYYSSSMRESQCSYNSSNSFCSPADSLCSSIKRAVLLPIEGSEYSASIAESLSSTTDILSSVRLISFFLFLSLFCSSRDCCHEILESLTAVSAEELPVVAGKVFVVSISLFQDNNHNYQYN